MLTGLSLLSIFLFWREFSMSRWETGMHKWAIVILPTPSLTTQNHTTLTSKDGGLSPSPKPPPPITASSSMLDPTVMQGRRQAAALRAVSADLNVIRYAVTAFKVSPHAAAEIASASRNCLGHIAICPPKMPTPYSCALYATTVCQVCQQSTFSNTVAVRFEEEEPARNHTNFRRVVNSRKACEDAAYFVIVSLKFAREDKAVLRAAVCPVDLDRLAREICGKSARHLSKKSSRTLQKSVRFLRNSESHRYCRKK